jgi:hypothetical protein
MTILQSVVDAVQVTVIFNDAWAFDKLSWLRFGLPLLRKPELIEIPNVQRAFFSARVGEAVSWFDS